MHYRPFDPIYTDIRCLHKSTRTVVSKWARTTSVICAMVAFSAGCTFEFDDSGLTYSNKDVGIDIQEPCINSECDTANKETSGDDSAATSDIQETSGNVSDGCTNACDVISQPCVLGMTRCDPRDPSAYLTCARVESADDTRTVDWQLTPCPLFTTCKNGECVEPDCLPGTVICDPENTTGRLRCDATGVWLPAAHCSDDLMCMDGVCVAIPDPCDEIPGTCLDTQWFPCGTADPEQSIACVLSPCVETGCQPVQDTCTANPDDTLCLSGDPRGLYRCQSDQKSAIKIADCPSFSVCKNGQCTWPTCFPDQPATCVGDGGFVTCSKDTQTLQIEQCDAEQYCIPKNPPTCESACFSNPGIKFCSGFKAFTCPKKPLEEYKVENCTGSLSCSGGTCEDLLLYEQAKPGGLLRDIYVTRFSQPNEPWVVAGRPDVDESQPVHIPSWSAIAYFYDDDSTKGGRKIAFRSLDDLSGPDSPGHPRFLSELLMPQQQRFSVSADGKWLALGGTIPFAGPRIGLRQLLGGSPIPLAPEPYPDRLAPRFHPNGLLSFVAHAANTNETWAVMANPNDPLPKPAIVVQIPKAIDMVLSPDTRFLAYVVAPSVQNDCQIRVVSMDTVVDQPVNGMLIAKDPVFSADSTTLYFAGKPMEGGKDLDIFRMKLPEDPKGKLPPPEKFLTLPGDQSSPAILIPPMVIK